ncbi:MAG: phenylacetate--CoA ligase [Rhizobacter sp.]
MVLDEEVIVEIVRPGTGEPVSDGEVGEVVVTTLNPDYPLIRFGTGDLSAVLPGPCPTGRSHTRIRGWLGRADQTAKVRGMFVHPSQVATIVSRHPEVQRARLVVDTEATQDRMTLWVETAALPDSTKARLSEQLITSMRDITKLRGEVQFSNIGSLPNDGKVVVDQRPVG